MSDVHDEDSRGQHLLSDADVARFVATGYHLVEPQLADGLNESIADKLNGMTTNPGDAITEEIPELWQVLDHPVVKGVLISLLGPSYEVKGHRHWHCKEPGSGHMQWHQDSTNNRDISLNRFLGLYYPRDVTPDMGPTVILPGTQFRNAPTDRMATYTNLKGQVPLVVKAGTVAFTHYDLWHAAAANSAKVKRHMIKFLFGRTEDNKQPTWNHDPSSLGKGDDVNNILSSMNPLGVAQSDHYKERAIRRQCWEQLMGKAG